MNARLSLLLVGMSVVGACATAPSDDPPVPTVADRHKIIVAQSSERLELGVSDAAALSNEERASLTQFARTYIRAGHGAMIMSTPSGAANSDTASLKANQARIALVDAGVPFAAVAGSTYDGAGQADPPIVLTFTHYEAQAPECAPLWTQDLGHQSNNQPWESFGCAAQANLAALLEDPHDLLGPRDEDPRDSARRGVVFGAYRNGEQTHAERTKDERVAISDAVD